MISIIIPTYNSEKSIHDCLKSVLDQTFADWEIIVVDDGSHDLTRSIIESFGKKNGLNNRLVTHYFKKNRGASAARNKGIRLATGDYIAFLDSDDVWYPKKLETVMAILSGDNTVDLVCHNENMVVNRKIIKELYYSRTLKDINSSPPQKIFRTLIGKNFLSPSAVTIKKTCLVEHPFDEGLMVAEDYDLWLRLSRRYRFYFLDAFLGEFKADNPLSLSNRAAYKCMFECLLKVISKQKNQMSAFAYYKRIIFCYLFLFKNDLTVLLRGRGC
ncbi:MAG: glycosyltransferase [Deltaproteobacteria bacterium]|nr:glycosyltransferase [Deltaproteobacteria bacterium]